MGRGRATAAILVAGLVAGGCGGKNEDTTSDRVTAYVERANKVQQRAAPVFDRANTRYRAYAQGSLKGADAELQLRSTEVELAAVQRRLAAVQAPPAARELRRRLLRVYAMEVALAAETRQMAGYVPQAERTLASLDAVRTRLRTRLNGARTPPRQIAALRTYAGRLDAVRTRLRRLEVPPVLTATHEAQLDRLTRTRSLALRLTRAIRARDAVVVARLLKAFRSAGGPDPVADLLATGAIKAYQQRVTMVSLARGEVARERARLLRAAAR
ncbi:MAG: hypothetical protein JWP18_2295 [Solirubrobacterales bacterium]|nr:hypothetical protein [Solirubrobacterales bacterium]